MGDVMRLRAAYDRVRLRFPIEITVVGSSGLGWFSPSLAREVLAHKVGEVAKACSPFAFRFGGVKRFPNSGVYYLAPADDKPFHAFQANLAASDLPFEATPYRYVPHCTIAELPRDAAPAAHEALMHCPVPDHDIHVTSVSLYSLDREAQCCYQHERIALG
jgi:2'-5' RNA ligase